jgi:SAM-dependent methyltransferase
VVRESKKQTTENVGYSGQQQLLMTEEGLKNYNKYLVKTFAKYSGLSQSQLNSKNTEVLDFGAGYGSLSVEWRTQFDSKIECLEIDPSQAQKIQELKFICHTELSSIEKKYDFIFTSNVLEHIENDVDALIDLKDKLKSGAQIAIYVPAKMILFSGLDQAVGHYRRYEKQDLIQKVKTAGFDILEIRYVDTLGFFAALLIRVIGYNGRAKLGSQVSFKIYDQLVFPLSRIFDFVGFKFLFGKNLLLIATNRKIT